MKISVCIPVFNVAEYLPECFDSVRNTLGLYNGDVKYEILIVDDASTDESFAICSDFVRITPNAMLVRHEKNKGLAEVRNTLLSIATGDYIAWVDSDDYVTEDWFAKIADTCEKYSPDVFAFELTRFSSRFSKESHFGHYSFGLCKGSLCKIDACEYALKVLMGLSILDYSPTRVVKRKLHVGISYRAPRGIYEDTVFACDFLPRVKCVYYYAGSLYMYRQRHDSLMHIRGIDGWIKEIEYQLEHTVDKMPEPYQSAAKIHVMSSMRRVMVASAKEPDNVFYKDKVKQYRTYYRMNLFFVIKNRHVPFSRKIADILSAFSFSDFILKNKKN